MDEMQKLFSIRTANERGQAFLEALRMIVDADPSKPNQTDVVMRLVFEEAARVKRIHGLIVKASEKKGRK